MHGKQEAQASLQQLAPKLICFHGHCLSKWWAVLVQILAKTEPAVTQLRNTGVDLSRWFVPTGYVIHDA